MAIQFPLTLALPLSLPLFLSQVSGPLLDLPACPLNHLVPLLPKFRAVQWDKENITAGTGVPTATVEDLVKPAREQNSSVTTTTIMVCSLCC